MTVVPEPVRATAWVLVWLLCSAPLAWSAGLPEAEMWLKRMTQAVRDLNYSGTFVTLQDGRMESMDLAHMVVDGDERERLAALSGPAREVIRDNDKVICYWTAAGSALVNRRGDRPSFPRLLPEDLSDLSDQYVLKMGGDDRMTGRAAKKVAIEARDAYRFGYRFWLDEQTALPLKSDLLDHQHRPVRQIMFTSLHLYSKPDPEQLTTQVGGQQFQWLKSEPEESREHHPKAGWKLAPAPPGFHLEEREWRRFSGSPADVEHLLYSDGLASFSVFVESLEGQPGTEGLSRMGAVSAFGRVSDGYQITVVGEVPMKTVRQAATAVRREAGP